MPNDTVKLTVRLSREQIEFAKRFAKANGLTVTEVISRYFARLQLQSPTELSPEVMRMVGLLPPDIDEKAVYHAHLVQKHTR